MSEIDIVIPQNQNPINIDIQTEQTETEVQAQEQTSNTSYNVGGDPYYCDLAKDWAIKMTGKVQGQDYSSKYYADLAKTIETEIAADTNNAYIWAEGTDAEVEALGGEHSSKGWVNFVLTNPPEASVEQTETGCTLTVTDINGTTTADLLNGVDGQDGQDGEDGVGIASIEKTSTSGLVDTYTITYTDSDTDTFTVTNGKDGTNGTNGTDGQDGEDGVGIASIEKTSTSGLVDTYTITYTDSDTDTFTVTNGKDGTNGTNGTDGQDGVSVTGVTLISTVDKVKTYRMSFSDNTYFDYDVTDGSDGGISNYVTTDTTQNITGTKTFIGQKKIEFKQSAAADKLGFTCFNNSSTEIGAFEYRPNTISSKALLNVNCPYTGDYVGFRYWGTAVNVVAPKVATAGTYYIPTHITDGNTTVTAANTGTVNISSLLPTVPTNISAFTNDSGYITSSALSGYATETWVGQQGYALTSSLATVATSGSYNDLSNKPTIPSAQVNSDWDAVSGVAQILNKPSLGTMASESASDYTPTSGLATVATTGDYDDLINKPTIPSISNLADKDLSNLSVTGEAKFQAPLVSGTNIKTINNTSVLGSGDIDTSEIFVAEFGITSFSDIEAADNAGKMVFCKKQGRFSYLSDIDSTIAKFSACDSLDMEVRTYYVDDTDTWDLEIQTLTVDQTFDGTSANAQSGVAIIGILDSLYPVGAIYIGTMATCPLATLGIGTWQLVAQDRVLQGAGTRGSVGTTISESLPNIKGVSGDNSGQGLPKWTASPTGAIYDVGVPFNIGTNNVASAGSRIGFDASLSSSTYQDNAPVQQDGYLVNIWERTA